MVAKSVGRAIAGLLVFPPAALALGLGDIRLNSSLNSPLDAEIELIGATPEELASLKAQIASRDTFERYGLEWPAHLGTIALSPVRTPDGREVLRLRSSEVVTEPFVTLLVEVSWARGRLVREYTMLLDPPVYTPVQSAATPVVAPSTGTEARGGVIERAPTDVQTAPAESTVAAPSVAAPVAAPGAGESTYTVRRGDTLSGIASELAGGDRVEARRWMVALFQANPSAFDGNMNILRSGAVLRIPDAATVAAISPGEAAAEVRRQYAAWRGAAPERSSADEPGRLRLVTPSDASSDGVTAGSGADSAALQSRIQQLEAELQESRRLLELRNAELARLQQRLGEVAATPPAAPAEPAAEEAESELEIEAAPTETVAAAETPEETVDEAPAVSEEPAPAPAVAQAPAAPATAATTPETPAEAESSLFDTLKGLWWVIALLAAAVAGLFGLRAWRSRQQTNLDESLGRLAAAGAELAERGEPVISPSPAVTRPVPAPREDSFVVEESGVHARPAFTDEAPLAAAARSVSVDDTIGGEVALNDAAINLDQGDPLAEADFHMAYGLYDQAADLVRMAISREPERRDLKLKLLEVFFVWGNREQFLQTARELAETRDAAAPGEWEKIVIMGKQLAPDDPLFSGGVAVSGAAAGGVDLDLEGGQNRVDFDLMGEPVPAAPVDLDIGSALGEKSESEEISSTQATDRHFALDDSASADADSATGTTREMTAQITAEMPGGFASTEMLPGFGEASDAPTVEQPALRSPDNPTIRQKVEMALRQQGGADQTAELAIDDLGLDLGALESTGEVRGLDSEADAPTMVAGLDERSRQIMEEAERRAGETGTSTTFTATGSWNFDADELATQIAPSTAHEFQDQTLIEEAPADASATSELAGLQVSRDVDFDLGDINTALREANGGVDLDVGPATPPDGEFVATQRLSAEDMALPELEPVTMSEVGTKLDLARAYMDMGDPEGARNILEEVLQEGSVAQKQEAQRLIEALPG